MATYASVWLDRRSRFEADLVDGEPALRITDDEHDVTELQLYFGGTLAQDAPAVIARQLGDLIGELIRIRSVYQAAEGGPAVVDEPTDEPTDEPAERRPALTAAAIRASYLPAIAPDGDHFHYPAQDPTIPAEL